MDNVIDMNRSAALGQSAPVDDVPVGFMVLATCPLILWLLDGTVAGIASALLIITLFAVGLVFLSFGQKNHLAYDAAEIAPRPKIPFKLIGSCIVALVIGLLASTKISVPAIPLVIGMSIFILCLVSFGLDPMRDKGTDNPALRMRFVNQRVYQDFDDRFERLAITLSDLDDDELSERTRIATNKVMGLLGTVDLKTPTLQKIAPSVSKMLTKMEAEVATLVDRTDGLPSRFERRKFHMKMVALVDAFEVRARKSGIARGRNNFELQTDVLFQRMNRKDSV
ncbi:hypothetical protein [uncultured Marivita sp.]|uniref:hypothetical protein n=1 Tax=uncultured Marivita sp. TaxID=888080 RepID=UPI00262BE9E8|nr:hypothetical protein [uncultured Marivita sp.]